MNELDSRTARICTRPDCGRPSKARGLCHNHYSSWHNSLKKLIGPYGSQDVLRAAMPGTIQQIAAESGVAYEAARKAIRKLHDDGEIHIEDFRPPVGASGHWIAVFADGPGEDFVLTKKMRREQSLRARREWYAANLSRPRRADPLVTALFGMRVATVNAEG